MPLISILTPLYNKPDLTLQFLTYLQNQTSKLFECILIDNHSKTPLPVKHKEYDFPLYYLYLKKNYYFSEAINKALPLCQGEWVWILNSDVFLYKNALTNLISHLPSLNTHGMIYFDIWQKQKGVITSNLKPGFGMKPVYAHFRDNTQFGPLGCSIFMNALTLHKIYQKYHFLFHPEISFYYTDLDLSLTLKREKISAAYIPILIATHLENMSIESENRPQYRKSRFSFLNASSAYRSLVLKDRLQFLHIWRKESPLLFGFKLIIEIIILNIIYFSVHFLLTVKEKFNDDDNVGLQV